MVLTPFSLSVPKAASTRCSLARASQMPGIREQTFHANGIMEVATRFKVQPIEFSTIYTKSLQAHPRNFTRASKLGLIASHISLASLCLSNLFNSVTSVPRNDPLL
jgi:hypothetical protein